MALPSTLMLVSLAIQAASALDVNTRCKSSIFEPLLDANATIETVDIVSTGDEYGEGAVNLGYPINPTNLPELCAVIVKVESSSNSSFRFGLFLPTEWNSRVLTVGNGGFAGGINWLDMGPGSHHGFATVSTDTGHNSITTDLSWALDNEEARIDWGWRAIHGSVTQAKKLVAAYYEEEADRSYYTGCSTGGRQGMRELQKFPDSFDGAMIGAPAWNPPVLNSYVTQVGIFNLPVDDPRHIKVDLLEVIAAEAVKQCDGVDGVEDGIISEPGDCKVDLSALSCDRQGIDQEKCLTDAQIDTANKVYGDFYSPSGEFVWTGYNPGSEVQWNTVIGADEPTPFGTGFQRYFVYNDPNWSWENDFNFTVFEDTVKLNPGESRADKYDLSDFKALGGKIVLYHGMADGLVPERSSSLYYDRVSSAMGGHPTDFFRYFPVPGMLHCGLTVVDAPWHFAGVPHASVMGLDSWSVPGFRDSQHDLLLALVDWVEKDVPVDSIIATTWTTQNNASTGVLRQRPICPFPQKSVYDGRGDMDDASSWECKLDEQVNGGEDDEGDNPTTVSGSARLGLPLGIVVGIAAALCVPVLWM
ncbi:hypothetical protein jhhlp_006648 [Lomentospora prolificans]|uniref:Carboxylic ester hydrolase n=1 Tax=Lomentospora prolificans TaxID=41688 RepID=A0A2N3N6I7_9PEZI|nr:hypothetical protein jhhlp_006648 [Lomentospora prolificans]